MAKITETSDHEHASTSSSPPRRDSAFYLGLTFVLEPRDKSIVASEKDVRAVLTTLELHGEATTTRDSRSKNIWLHTSTAHLTKIRRLAKKNTVIDAFTIREFNPNTPEETRIQHHISSWLASDTGGPDEGATTSSSSQSTTAEANRAQRQSKTSQPRRATKSEPEEAGPSTSNTTPALEDDGPRNTGKRKSSRRIAGVRQGTPAPARSSSPDNEHLAGPSRARGKRKAARASSPDEELSAGPSRTLGKRTAARAFSPAVQAPAANSRELNLPEDSIQERPSKRVKFDLDRNTYKVFEEWKEPEPLPRDNNDSGAVVTSRPTIKDLPSDCLKAIFVHGTPDPAISSAKEYRLALYDLMSVCLKWKSTAEGTPALWSHLSNANPPGMMDACVQRSSTATVTVQFDGSMEYPSNVESALKRFVDRVTPLRSRWTSVRFNDVPPTRSSYSAVATAFGGPAPALTSAEVTTIHGTTIPFVHALRFFAGEAPALRHVTLTGVVPQLEEVEIFGKMESFCVFRPMGISPAYLLRMLGRNNRLRHLELVDVRPSYARLFQNIETLELSELIHFKLHLSGENTAEMAQLFTRLRAPKCRRLDLTIDMDNLKNLNLPFNFMDFNMEVFLVGLGTWMSRLIVLNRARSVDRWVDPAPDGASSKPAFRWQYGGAFDGSYRGLSADVRLEVENRCTKKIISKWVKDVKLHAELVREEILEGVSLGSIESFGSYRRRLLEARESENPEDDIQPHDFMGIWDIGN
ncbi:hypothetical protein FRC04_003331 [Tulasnella sp. 424]|nr:hypothetical protein FRC04_003331 [Tulasnella sp. 424]KAG8977149.1 hypothetical protein FRC05_002146 [Tulasnella sp. 425]